MGLHFIPDNLNINFVGFRRISYIISAVLLLASLISLIANGGPKYGIDFAGGTVVQVKFEQPIADEELKAAMADSALPGLVVQSFDTDNKSYLLRLSQQEAETANAVREAISTAFAEKLPSYTYTIQRLEMVGPKVGADLRSKALEALFFATLFISVYVSGRFEHRWFTSLLLALTLAGGMYGLDLLGVPVSLLVALATIITLAMCWYLKLAYALGAIVSIAHDLFIAVGIFSILGKDFDLTIIAALLTVVGYSLNDTIIVYDRIRENIRSTKSKSLAGVINTSINQTMSRTVLTSVTTLLVIIALLVLGGDIIHDFSLVMCIGVLVGTYSSIFVASPILLIFEKSIWAGLEKAKEEEAKAEANKRNVAQV